MIHMPDLWFLLVFIVIYAASLWMMYRYARNKGIAEFTELLFKNGYDQKVAAFNEQNKWVEPGGIVFLGDSITQDYAIHDYFFGKTLYNRGIGGDTTEGVLKRLEESVFALKPTTVVVLIGTNDYSVSGSGNDRIYDNIRTIIKTIHERLPSCHVIVQSVYPVNPTLDPMSVGVRSNRAIDALNERLKGMEDITYVNVADRLKDTHGRLDESLTLEGLHLNQNGYAIVTEALASHL